MGVRRKRTVQNEPSQHLEDGQGVSLSDYVSEGQQDRRRNPYLAGIY